MTLTIKAPFKTFKVRVLSKFVKDCPKCGKNAIRQVGTNYYNGQFYLVMECLLCDTQYWLKKGV
jgi:hypothetical protein